MERYSKIQPTYWRVHGRDKGFLHRSRWKYMNIFKLEPALLWQHNQPTARAKWIEARARTTFMGSKKRPVQLPSYSQKTLGFQTWPVPLGNPPMLSHLLYLLFHGFDVVLSRFYLFLQLLYFVIQHKLELFQFLIFLLQVIDPFFLKKERKNAD